MTTLVENYLAMSCLNLLALGILSVLVHRSEQILYGRKASFQAALLVTVLVVLAELGTVLAKKTVWDLWGLNLFCNALGFALTPLIPLLLTCIFESKNRKIRTLLLLPGLGNGLLSLLSPRFGLIFSLSRDNGYHRGPAFFLFVLAYCWSIFLVVWMIGKQVKYRQYQIQQKLGLLLAFLLLGTAVQVLHPLVHVTWSCVTLAMILYYGIIVELDDKLDQTTELYSRRSYEQKIRALEQKKQYIILIADVDQFKQANDCYGHQYGDQCLLVLAQMLQKAVGKTGNCFRYGGDEFCVLCEHGRVEELEHAMERFVKQVAAQRQRDVRLPAVSYGYAAHREGDGLHFQQVFRLADEQMYAYKKKREEVVSEEGEPCWAEKTRASNEKSK